MGRIPFSIFVWPAQHSRRAVIALCGVALLMTATGTGPLLAATRDDYSQSQASAGQQIYTQHCAACHGSQLQGGAGPALAGPKFADNLSYSKMTAKQLFDFIKSQMPNDAPGSLSDRQYLDVFAYILSKNGYPAGLTALSEKTLGQIKLLPYPGGNSDQEAGTTSSPK